MHPSPLPPLFFFQSHFHLLRSFLFDPFQSLALHHHKTTACTTTHLLLPQQLRSPFSFSPSLHAFSHPLFFFFIHHLVLLHPFSTELPPPLISPPYRRPTNNLLHVRYSYRRPSPAVHNLPLPPFIFTFTSFFQQLSSPRTSISHSPSSSSCHYPSFTISVTTASLQPISSPPHHRIPQPRPSPPSRHPIFPISLNHRFILSSRSTTNAQQSSPHHNHVGNHGLGVLLRLMVQITKNEKKRHIITADSRSSIVFPNFLE